MNNLKIIILGYLIIIVGVLIICYESRSQRTKSNKKVQSENYLNYYTSIKNGIFNSDGTKIYVILDNNSIDVYEVYTSGNWNTSVFCENIKL